MSESRFFEPPSGMTIGEIVALTGAQAKPGTDLSRHVTNIAPPDRAEAGDLTFVESGKFLDALKSTRAAACLIGRAVRVRRAGQSRRAAQPPAPGRFHRRGAQDVCERAAPGVAVRHHRHCAERRRSSVGQDRQGRDRRSRRRGRTQRRGRRRHRDRRDGGDRTRGPDRPRLLDRSRLHHHAF